MKIDIDSISFEEIEKSMKKEKKSMKSVSTSSHSTTSTKTSSLSKFFRDKGLKVIDLRNKGGCLWVLGDKSSIGNIVDEAIKKFRIDGGYSSGRATGHKPAWWTRSNL